MFGVESMPYCWAAKSRRKEVGAAQRAVECEMPILFFCTAYDVAILRLNLCQRRDVVDVELPSALALVKVMMSPVISEARAEHEEEL